MILIKYISTTFLAHYFMSWLPCNRGYIFAVWAGVWKVASADNCSIFLLCMREIYRAIRKQN